MITSSFRFPFYRGGGASTDVPGNWDVAINGRNYLLDVNSDAFISGLQTVPLLRSQADNSTLPGEGSINPDDLWPRSQQTWHHGAGQEFLDRQDSDPYRFHQSIGIDPWSIGQLKLHHSTVSRGAVLSGSTNNQLLRVDHHLYHASGNALRFTSDAGDSGWTTVAIQAGNTPATAVSSMTSDGYNIYAAMGANGINATVRGTSTASDYNALNCTLIGYVKGRLMAANSNVIYNVTSGATPTALFTHPNTDFVWTGFAEGTNVLYAAGYSGDKSLIYKTAVVADGTALAIPTVAGELPDGEIVRAIQGYLGFVVVGTDKGFRLANQDANGNLTFGALVSINKPVLAFEPQGQYVWFNWTAMDATHTGLGRMDLTTFTSDLVPAYATDLSFYSSTGQRITSVATDWSGVRAFVGDAGEVWFEASELLPPLYTASYPSGADAYITMGKVDFGLGDDKVALRLKLRHAPLATTQSLDSYVSVDSGTFQYIGTSSNVATTGTAEPLHVPNLSGRTFEVKLQPVNGTTIERYDLQAYPAGATRGRTILVPLLLVEKLSLPNHADVTMNPLAEYEYLNGLVGSGTPSTYQELSVGFSVFVEEVQFQRRDITDDRTWWNGTALLRLKVLGE